MAYSTVVAYAVLFLLTPVPNVAIISYINQKPILTKVSSILAVNSSFHQPCGVHSNECLNLFLFSGGTRLSSQGYDLHQLDNVSDFVLLVNIGKF